MKDKEKKVSVIIPAFNAEKYISECLISVINQSYDNLEIIVVNDGSTDKTSEILNNFSDSRIIVVNQENKGCSAAKNIGLRMASGDYIQYLDADDYLSVDKIEKQVNLIQSKNNCISVCRTIIASDDPGIHGTEINTQMINKNLFGKDFLLNLLGTKGELGMVQPNAYLIPREISEKIGQWNEEISPSPDEDGEYFSRVLLSCDTVFFSEGVNYYRKNISEPSLSKKFDISRAFNLLRTVELKFSHLFKIEDSERIKSLYQINISQIAYQFGVEYPEIINFSIQKLKLKGINKLNVKGPRMFFLLSAIFGFEKTIFLKKQILMFKRRLSNK